MPERSHFTSSTTCSSSEPAESVRRITTQSTTAAAIREHFNLVYQELIDSGSSEVDAAARALLVASGREEAPNFVTVAALPAMPAVPSLPAVAAVPAEVAVPAETGGEAGQV